METKKRTRRGSLFEGVYAVLRLSYGPILWAIYNGESIDLLLSMALQWHKCHALSMCNGVDGGNNQLLCMCTRLVWVHHQPYT